MSLIRDYLSLVEKAMSELPEEKIRDVVETLKAAHADGRQVFLLGNGGSAATATHLAEDLQKGVRECTGRRFKVFSLAESAPLITAWANDTSYENVFAAQLDCLLEPGDVVVAISGSGNSPNVIKAVEKANEMGAITIGWSGFAGGKLAQTARKSIVVNSDNMQRIEDVHMILGHLVVTCLMKECGRPG